MALLWKKFEFFDPFWVLFCQNSNFSPKKEQTNTFLFLFILIVRIIWFLSPIDGNVSRALLFCYSDQLVISRWLWPELGQSHSGCVWTKCADNRSIDIHPLYVSRLFFFRFNNSLNSLVLEKISWQLCFCFFFSPCMPAAAAGFNAAALFFYVLWFHIHDMSMSSSV